MKKFSSRSPVYIWVVACLVIVTSVAYFFFAPVSEAYVAKEQANLPAFPALRPTDRLTIVAPHLDDEGLGVGGLIAEARRQNIPVSVIFMTNGDCNVIGTSIQFKTGYPTADQYLADGALRQQEALQATTALGVTKQDVYFLGLPDQGLQKLLQPEYFTHPYTSLCTLKSKSPYILSAIPNLSYTGASVKNALTGLINKTNPTLLFAPVLEDHHPDHAASGEFVQQILPTLTSQPSVYTYLVHYPKYPVPAGINPSLPLLPPPSLADRTWQRITLSPADVERKQLAVDSYPSQLQIPEVGTLLRSLVRSNEIVIHGF